MSTILGWHFVGATLRDGRPVPPDGEWLVHDGPTAMCECGLHGSRKLMDALYYAPGFTICRVRFADVEEEDYDKLVARRRKILWRVDGGPVLRAFARKMALKAASIWSPPEVVLEYLRTGNEALRADAKQKTYEVAGMEAGPGDKERKILLSWNAASAWPSPQFAGYGLETWGYRKRASATDNAMLTRMVREAHNGRKEWVFE